MTDLNPLDPALFDFIRDSGFRFKGAGGSLLHQSLAISKTLTDKEFREIATAIRAYLDDFADQRMPPTSSGPIYTRASFRPYTSRYGFKFIHQDAYDQYITNGSFLVSSLERFRDWEGQGNPAGDRLEGYTYCGFRFGANKELLISTVSGFNCHVLSLTRDLQNYGQMRGPFGSVALRIELQPFAEGLADALGAKSFEIQLVKYADLKTYRDELTETEIAGFPPDLTAELAVAIRDRGWHPSLFIKPERFRPEREIRVAFQMDADVAPSTSLHLPQLLRYVQRVR